MLNIINNLSYFFEDCYGQISVREFSRMLKISPPTASKILKNYNKEGFLHMKEMHNHLFFNLNNENKDVIDLSRIYWRHKLKPVITEINKTSLESLLILFGSLSKAENKKDSDIDLALFSKEKISIDLKKFEKMLKRKISLYHFNNLKDIKNKYLKNNIINGYKLLGKLQI